MKGEKEKGKKKGDKEEEEVKKTNKVKAEDEKRN